MDLAVEVAPEGVAIAADGCEVVCVDIHLRVPNGGGAVGDVRAQLEVFARVVIVFVGVDAGGEVVELVGGGDPELVEEGSDHDDVHC